MLPPPSEPRAAGASLRARVALLMLSVCVIAFGIAYLGVASQLVSALERQPPRGARYWGSATTRIFCLATCAHARRITPEHRVPFASVAAAKAAGFRPCKVCRPA